MVKELTQIIPFHKAMIMYYGRKAQINKVIEELNELDEALNDFYSAITDPMITENAKMELRDHIVEEIADVELVLPYVKMIYRTRSDIVITRMGDYDYKKAKDILVLLLKRRLDIGKELNIERAIDSMLKHIAFTIHNLYAEFQIRPGEVDGWKDEKIRRTIKRAARQIIGNK